MLSNKYKTAKALLVGACLSTVIASCKKDFFEIDDPNGLDDAVMWTDPGAVNLFLNRTYQLVMPQWPTLGGIHNTSDELNNANTAFLYGTLVENSVTDIGTSTGITANRYADIRRCNVAIENINGSSALTQTDKDVLKGQFFFLRAYTYFKLVRLYGGVPLVLKAQTIDGEELQVPRAKTSECVAAIVSDLDSAALMLPKTWTAAESGKITSAAARSVKGKVLLYWASPQFNIANDAARWAAAYAANKAAYDTCIAHGYQLLANYSNIFLTEDHKEALLIRKYLPTKDLGQNVENVTRPSSESTGGGGSNQPTWNLVQAYTMKNGLPITNGSSGYDAIQFWLNRDPRFDATIAYNGVAWPLSGKTTRKQWSYTGVLDETSSTIVTGFYCRRFCNPALTAAQAVYNSNTGGGNGMDWIEMRFAEVILNLAECANETDNLTEAKNMVRLIRQRAGIVVGTADYGLDVATDKATMRTLILAERQVEFAMEGMRNFDLRRTRNLQLISARMGYKITPKPPYYAGTGTVAGRIYLDKPDAFGVRPRDTANLNNPSVYTSMFSVPPTLTSLEGSNIISIPEKYYAYPMPNLFMQTPAIQQTIGWAGGTFNPFE
jgi:starch-binding outer membrane protein, SusD/RagB family